MIQTMHAETLVETLLNTLEAERYVRAPLLLTIVDELAGAPGFEAAAHAAQATLDGLRGGRLGESEFVARVATLRHLVQTRGAASRAMVLVTAAASAASAA